MQYVDRMIQKHSGPLDPLETILRVKGTMKCKLSEMLTRNSSKDKHSLSVIADLKRQSPTHTPSTSGLRLSYDDAGEVVETMANTGFDVVFVNTDDIAYKGTIEDFKSAVCSAYSIGNRSRPAVVMKDVILHPLQLAEAAQLHADGVVLNAFYLGPALESMIETSYNLGLEPIVEVHTIDEALYALQFHAQILMVNQWERVTNKCHINRALQLREIIPEGVIAIACGGIKTLTQIEHLGLACYDAVVLGKKLIDADIPSFVKSIKSWAAPAKGILHISKAMFFTSIPDDEDSGGGGYMVNVKENYREVLEEMKKFYQVSNAEIETPEAKDVMLNFIGNDLPEKWNEKREKWMREHAHEYKTEEHANAVYDFNVAVELNTALKCNKKLLLERFKHDMIEKLEKSINNYVRRSYLNLKNFSYEHNNS